jgi:hypothetical protein
MEPVGQRFPDQAGLRNIDLDSISRPPFRSVNFIGATLVMGIDFAVTGVVLVTDWATIPTMAVCFMAVAVFSLITLWIRVYLSSQKLHEVYCQAKLRNSLSDPLIHTALRHGADVATASLILPFTTALWFLVVVAEILNRH